MVMDRRDALDIALHMLERRGRAQRRTAHIENALDGSRTGSFFDLRRRAHTDPEGEKAKLLRLASSPVLDLIVAETAQQMILEGVTITGDEQVGARMFAPWENNGLVSGQYALWRAMLTYGEAYVMVLPGVMNKRTDRAAWMGAYSPRTLTVEYDDPFEDEYPTYAVRVIGGNTPSQLRLYDDEALYTFTIDTTGTALTLQSVTEHGCGVCPVVTFANERTLDGRSIGEVEKYETVANRLEKTIYDRVLAQHYNSWKVRYATGLTFDTQSDADDYKQKLSQEDNLTGGEGVQFGTLAETNLQGILQAADADRDMLAAVSQTPVWALNGGQLVNLSAEALAEARSMQRLKVKQKQAANGVNVARALRLAAAAEGRVEDATRYDLTVQWADVEAYSLNQIADGLQKLSTMGIPPGLLVDMIPGLTPTQIRQWREEIDRVTAAQTASDALTVELGRQLANGINQ